MTQNYRVTSVTLVLGGWEPKWTSSVADVFCKGAEMITADLEVFFQDCFLPLPLETKHEPTAFCPLRTLFCCQIQSS